MSEPPRLKRLKYVDNGKGEEPRANLSPELAATAGGLAVVVAVVYGFDPAVFRGKLPDGMTVASMLMTISVLIVLMGCLLRSFSGAALRRRFESLGFLKGRTAEEIIEVAGPPNSRSVVPDDVILLQWSAPGYHIALAFRDGICEGITHEFEAGGLKK